MTKLTTVNTILISIMLFNTISLHAMIIKVDTKEYEHYLQHNFKIRAQEAEKYNQHNPLLIKELLDQMFPSCLADDDDHAKSLENSIKNFMKLNMVCKKFNKLLTFEAIGEFCQNYTPQIKVQTFRKLMQPTYKPNDEIKYLPALIVLCAGIDINPQTELNNLLIDTVRTNNIQVARTLFKHHANPDARNEGNPFFFHAKTVEMAQLFIKNEVDVNMISDWPKTNILWEIVKNEYPSELMDLYLGHGVDATKLRCFDDACLLHRLAWLQSNMDDNFFKKAKLLLAAIPHMINTINKKGYTPVDIAQLSLKKSSMPETFEKLITLFKEHGGKTAQEL